MQRLSDERRDLLIDAARSSLDEDGERMAPPRRIGEATTPPRVAEIDTEIEALYDRMRESEGDLVVRAVGGGEWQLFKDSNPPREGNKSDEENAYGLLSAAAVLANLALWVESWNGENFTAGAWDEWFKHLVSSADLNELCKQVVQAQESSFSVPKARSTDSSARPMSESA